MTSTEIILENMYQIGLRQLLADRADRTVAPAPAASLIKAGATAAA